MNFIITRLNNLVSTDSKLLGRNIFLSQPIYNTQEQFENNVFYNLEKRKKKHQMRLFAFSRAFKKLQRGFLKGQLGVK